jgi:hypothetical protein
MLSLTLTRSDEGIVAVEVEVDGTSVTAGLDSVGQDTLNELAQTLADVFVRATTDTADLRNALVAAVETFKGGGSVTN